MCRTGRNGEIVITGIKVNKSYVTSTFLRGKMPTLNDNDELPRNLGVSWIPIQ